MTAANYIGLADIYRILRRGDECDIVVCSYSEKRSTGGDRIEYHKAILVQRILSDNAKKFTPNAKEFTQNATSNPHHFANGTINIQLKNGSIEKIRPCLIEKFNGQPVAL